MYCPFCGVANPTGATRCDYCGGELPVPGRRERTWLSYRPGPGLGCMIGLAALGFLSLAIVVPQYVLYQRQIYMAREAVVRSNMRALRVTVEQYAAEYGQYPVGLEFSGTYANDQGLHDVQMMISRLRNPFDPNQASVVVSRADPPDWQAIKPGQIVYVPRDTFNGRARNYLIYGMGKKRILSDTMRGGFE